MALLPDLDGLLTCGLSTRSTFHPPLLSPKAKEAAERQMEAIRAALDRFATEKRGLEESRTALEGERRAFEAKRRACEAQKVFLPPKSVSLPLTPRSLARAAPVYRTPTNNNLTHKTSVGCIIVAMLTGGNFTLPPLHHSIK